MDDIAFAFVSAVCVWIWWGTAGYIAGWHDLGFGEAVRATFSPTFWRTGRLDG